MSSARATKACPQFVETARGPMTLDALSFYLARPQVLPSSIVKSTSAALRLCRMKAEKNIPLTTRAPFRSICLKHTPSGIAEAAPGQTRDGLSRVADAEPSTRRPRGPHVLMSLRPSPPHNGRNPRGQQRPWLLAAAAMPSLVREAAGSRQPSFPRASRRPAAAAGGGGGGQRHRALRRRRSCSSTDRGPR